MARRPLDGLKAPLLAQRIEQRVGSQMAESPSEALSFANTAAA
ncbi:MAG: hypothetical protein ACLPTM_08535 [Steroidobacteraceae bacterium]